MARRVLLIAFQFPPFAASSAVQRTLRFVQYLPEFGWEPVVLTAHERAFERTSESLMAEIPASVHVERAFALDAARHLSLCGRYPRAVALPDRWSSWLLGAIPAGLRLLRKYRPEAIWSTYPVATTSLVGLTLRKLSGLPWIADFRDPMYDDSYPTNATLRRAHRGIERWTVYNCNRLVLTAPGAVQLYRSRYPDVPANRFALIQNGYDESSFRATETIQRCRFSAVTLVHSGVIYPKERDPSALFGALKDLMSEGILEAGMFRIVLRATGHDQEIAHLVENFGVGSLVEICSAVPYHVALSEMQQADGLLVLQGNDCPYQIPAKVYECLRAGRPIVALVGGHTDTAAVLREASGALIADLSDRAGIGAVLRTFMANVAAGHEDSPLTEVVRSHSRQRRAQELSELLALVTADASI